MEGVQNYSFSSWVLDLMENPAGRGQGWSCRAIEDILDFDFRRPWMKSSLVISLVISDASRTC